MTPVKLAHEKLQDAPAVMLLSIGGDVTVENIHQVEAYFDQAVQADAPRHALVDLGGVTFADSRFFSSLLFWREEMTKRGGALVLYGLRQEVASTLRILCLDRVLTIRPDRAAALAALP